MLHHAILWSLLLCLLASTLPGCNKHASVSENQCKAGDWQTLGYRDGALGQRSSRLLAHYDACVEIGVTPDRETYMLGWREGIAEYCRPDHGFAEGSRNVEYRNVCPEELESAFLEGYSQGRLLYQARRAVADLEHAIQRKEHRVTAIDSEIVSAGAAQLDPLLLPETRVELAARVVRLAGERGRIQYELPALYDELALRRQELGELEQVPASYDD